jgi:hypothetical protein
MTVDSGSFQGDGAFFVQRRALSSRKLLFAAFASPIAVRRGPWAGSPYEMTYIASGVW